MIAGAAYAWLTLGLISGLFWLVRTSHSNKFQPMPWRSLDIARDNGVDVVGGGGGAILNDLQRLLEEALHAARREDHQLPRDAVPAVAEGMHCADWNVDEGACRCLHHLVIYLN